MLDFPEKTRDLASRTSRELRREYGEDRLALAQGVYKRLKGRFSYGFGEGIRQGTFIRWPHEIEKEWECIEAATYTYAVAEAAGLEPRMMSCKRWMGIDTGHETVDVRVNGHRVLIDPLNRMFGRVEYRDDCIFVEDNEVTGRCVLPCESIEEVPRDRAISRVDFYRSDSGIISLLEAGQTIQNDYENVFIRYDPRLKVFEFLVLKSLPFLESLYYSMKISLHHDNRKNATENGIYKGNNWGNLLGKEPLVISTKPKEEVKIRFPQPTAFGKEYLLGELLYHSLLSRKVTDLDSKPDSTFLFDSRERPLELLSNAIDDMRISGITPENKGVYNNLLRHYFSIVIMDQETNAGMQRILDQATLKMHIRDIARQDGRSPVTVCRRMLESLGVDEKDAVSFAAWSPSKKTMDSYPEEEIDSLFKRLYDGGLL